VKVLSPIEATASLTSAQQAMLFDLVSRTDSITSRVDFDKHNFVSVKVDDIYYQHMGAIGEGDGDAPAIEKVMDAYERSYRENGWRIIGTDDRTEYELSSVAYWERRSARIQSGYSQEKVKSGSMAGIFIGAAILLFPISLPLWVGYLMIKAWNAPKITESERSSRAALLVSLFGIVFAVVSCMLVMYPLMK